LPLSLHDALPIYGGRDLLEPPPFRLQLALPPALRFLCRGPLLRVLLGLLLRAERRQTRLGFPLHLLEEGHGRRRDVEGIQLGIRVEVEVVEERAVRFALAPLVEQGES